MTIGELNEPTALIAPSLKRSLKDIVFVAFDTETTGLSPVVARLVELSGVKFTADGKELSTFQALIDPEMLIPEMSTAVHGITDEMVCDAPTFHAVVPKFIEWACIADVNAPLDEGNKTVLLAHNAPFDLGFLEIALGKLDQALPDNIVLDSLPLARNLFPQSPNYQLKTLIEHVGIVSDSFHRALDDSNHVKELFLKMLDLIPEDADLESMVQISGLLRFLDRSKAHNESSWSKRPEYIRIMEAIADGLSLRISYSGVRKSKRIVTPRSVLFTGGTPYLSAFCHLASAERTFRIDKIISMESVEEQL